MTGRIRNATWLDCPWLSVNFDLWGEAYNWSDGLYEIGANGADLESDGIQLQETVQIVTVSMQGCVGPTAMEYWQQCLDLMVHV